MCLTLLTGEKKSLPVFTSWNGHTYATGAEPAEGGGHGHGSHHHPKQHHSTLRHIILRDGG